MTAMEDRIPDGLFGLRRHVGRRARCTAIVSGSWFDAVGACRPGVLGVLVDVSLGLEVAKLPETQSRGVVTSELEITFLDDAPRVGETLSSEGEVIANFDGGAFVHGTVRGDDERIVAVASATSRFVAQQRVGRNPSEQVDFAAPLDVPLDDVIGAFPVIHGDNASLTVIGTPRLMNFRGTVHGGVLALLAEWAASAALDAGSDWHAHSMRLHYVRPAAGEGRITASAVPLRRGRTVAIIEVAITGDDTLVCVARITYNRRDRKLCLEQYPYRGAQ